MFCDIQGDQTFDCSAKEEYCKHEVTFRETVKKCVTLKKGFLGAPDYIGSVCFNTTDPICVTESTGKSELGRFLQKLCTGRG